MSRRVRLEPEAEQELLDAALHYERQVSGLGHVFIESAGSVADRLSRWPGSGGLVDGLPGELEVRRVPLPRFPYQIVYLVRDEDVHVIAVAYDGREPQYWSGRLAT